MEKNIQSVGFSKFRELMDIWDEAVAENKLQKQIQDFLDGAGMVLFFKYEGSIYGAGEDSRLVFARIKHPNEDDPIEWQHQASFTAINLSKMLHGEPVQSVFNKKSFKKMKVIGVDKSVELLMKIAKKEGIEDFQVRDGGDNFIRTSED